MQLLLIIVINHQIKLYYLIYIFLIFRHFISGGTETTGVRKIVPKSMALTQWKIINHIKEYYQRIGTDKTMYQTVNKEFAKLLQKMQPAIYGEHLLRPLETKKAVSVEVEDTKKKEQGYNMTNVLSGLTKLTTLSKSDLVEAKPKPKWLVETPVSNSSIIARTSHIISAISTASSDEAKIEKIENLAAHLLKYPQAKHQAVKVLKYK